MTTCDEPTRKGGIATEEMTSLDDVMIRVIMPVMREYYKNQYLEREAHRLTIALLQEVADGIVSPESILTDGTEAWQIKPAGPESIAIADGWEDGLYVGPSEVGENGTDPSPTLDSISSASYHS